MQVGQNLVTDYTTANFSETETAWSSGAVYDFEDEARDGHYIYTYAGEDGTNSTLTPSLDSVNWVRTRPTNYFAMLDGATNTQTENALSIDVTFAGGNFSSIALFSLEAESLTIQVLDPISTVIFEEIVNLRDNSEIIDFYEYFFNPIVEKTKHFNGNLPIRGSTYTYRILIESSTIAKCGRLVLTQAYTLGETEFNANVGYETYSTVQTDQFGNTNFLQRPTVNIYNYNIRVTSPSFVAVDKKIKSLQGLPVLLVGDESDDSQFANLLDFGYIQTFNMNINNLTKFPATMTFKGII